MSAIIKENKLLIKENELLKARVRNLELAKENSKQIDRVWEFVCNRLRRRLRKRENEIKALSCPDPSIDFPLIWLAPPDPDPTAPIQQDENDRLRESVDIWAIRAAAAQKRVASLESMHSYCSSTIEDLKARVRELEAQVETSVIRRDTLRGRVSELEHAIEGRVADLADLRERNRALEAELESDELEAERWNSAYKRGYREASKSPRGRAKNNISR